MSIEEMEQLRKKIIKNERIIGLIVLTIIICVGIFAYHYYINNKSTMNIPLLMPFVVGTFIVCTIIYLVLYSILCAKKIEILNKNFKQIFVKSSLEKVFDSLEYNPDYGLKEEVIYNTNMMYMGDRYCSNDYIKGIYKNINIEGSDIHIEERHESTDSEGHTTTTYVTIFLGKWFIFDFNKDFKYNMSVVKRGFYGSSHYSFADNRYKKVELESEEFNKNYKVYAQNEEEAFYILTPNFIERIQNLCNSIKGSIMLCFVDNKLHVGLNNYEDSFEMNINKEINKEEIEEKINRDIISITKFVDELDLDNNLFKEV